MSQLIKSFDFTSNGKFNVNVYENRIEIKSLGAGNLLVKGITGITTIFLKHLTAIEYNPVAYLEFLTPGFIHQSSTTKKVQCDNVVLFTKKEEALAQELYDMIMELV